MLATLIISRFRTVILDRPVDRPHGQRDVGSRESRDDFHRAVGAQSLGALAVDAGDDVPRLHAGARGRRVRQRHDDHDVLRIIRLDPNPHAPEFPFGRFFQVLQVVRPDHIREKIQLCERPLGELADENLFGNLHRLLVHIPQVQQRLGNDAVRIVRRGQFRLGLPILDVVQENLPLIAVFETGEGIFQAVGRHHRFQPVQPAFQQRLKRDIAIVFLVRQRQRV